MFCPVCKSEYLPGFAQCGHCKVPLVEALTPGVLLDDVGVKAYFEGKNTIMVTQGAGVLCQEVQNILDEGGCPARIVPLDEDANMHAMFRLLITEADLEKAKGILGQRWQAMVTGEGLAAAPDREAVLAEGTETECPACGHKFSPEDPESAECPECGIFLGVPG